MKVKTPFEQAGFKVTDTFKVKSGPICSDCLIKGELTLHLDDGTEVPLFHDESGERWWLPLSSIEPVKVEPNGWIEWHGGGCPVGRGMLVDVKYRDGVELEAIPANIVVAGDRDASRCFWRHDGARSDIVAYRLYRPQKIDSQPSSECQDDGGELIVYEVMGEIRSAGVDISLNDAFEIAGRLIEVGYRK